MSGKEGKTIKKLNISSIDNIVFEVPFEVDKINEIGAEVGNVFTLTVLGLL